MQSVLQCFGALFWRSSRTQRFGSAALPLKIRKSCGLLSQAIGVGFRSLAPSHGTNSMESADGLSVLWRTLKCVARSRAGSGLCFSGRCFPFTGPPRKFSAGVLIEIPVWLGLDSTARGSSRTVNIPTPQKCCPQARPVADHGRTFCHRLSRTAMRYFQTYCVAGPITDRCLTVFLRR